MRLIPPVGDVRVAQLPLLADKTRPHLEASAREDRRRADGVALQVAEEETLIRSKILPPDDGNMCSDLTPVNSLILSIPTHDLH